MRHRLARMRAYRDRDVAEADIHLWQQSNPVVTEALVQLTWGGPQVIYNGGLQQARVRYYDADRAPPGPARRRWPPWSPASIPRPPSSTWSTSTRSDDRAVIVQAGAFAEHTIEAVRYTACEDGSWIGDLYDYGHGEPAVIERHADVTGRGSPCACPPPPASG